MPPETFNLRAQDVVSYTHLEEDHDAPGSTAAIRLTKGMVGVQLTGTGTVTAWVERTPSSEPENWGPADDEAIDGDLSTGIAALNFDEPVRGWWRVRITACTGDVHVSIIGEAA
jgi:hypothetical protein